MNNSEKFMAGKNSHSPIAVEKSDCSTEPRVLSKVGARPGRVLLVAAWFALVAGLGEVALQAIRKYYLHRNIFLSRDLVWMAPLADLFLIAIPGSLLFLAAWRWPQRFTLRFVSTVFAFFTFLSLLFMIGPLHKLAAVLLSAGLAVQTAHFIAAHPTGFQRIATRSLWGMLLVILALTALVSGSQFLREHRALSQLPPPPAGAPNVLFITLDTVRARSLSLYGYGRKTSPQLERLAKRGVVFERALATSPWTLPSHASMFTGRFPHELRADWNVPLDDQHPTLAEAFSAQGYLTAGFVANTTYCSDEVGLDRGFAHYEDYSRSPVQIMMSSSLGRFLKKRLLHPHIEKVRDVGRKTAEELNGDFLHWVSTADERPFFVFLNYFDAHAPYMPPAPFETKFGSKRMRPDATVLQDWTQEEGQIVMDAYDSSIAYLDHQLGLLFDELERRGVLENTLVVVTSDHGEQFGEHGLYDHGNSLYRPLLEVPLLISFPAKVPAAKRVREPVTLVDLPSTVVELTALQHAPRFPGSSLTRHWVEGRKLERPETPLLMQVSKRINMPERWPVRKGNMKSLVADGMHYIRNGDGREELYDFENDELEERDLSGTEEGRRALERFRKYLDGAVITNQPLTVKQEPR